MIRPIVDKIVTDLRALSFTDLVGGVVRTVEIKKSTQAGDILQRWPVINNPKSGDFIVYMPDSSKFKAVHFFVDKGTNLIVHNAMYDVFESDVRLYCWYNLKKINPDLLNASKLDRIILNTIPETIANFDEYARIYIERRSDAEKSKALWSEWSINDVEKQFVNYPFDISAIDLKIHFSYTYSCLTDIELKNIPCPA